jgi:phage-related protein
VRTARGDVLGAAAALWAAASLAHHSGAMFDYDRAVTLVGTVKQFQWTNPHCWIELSVLRESGAVEDWSVEMGAPLQLYQGGWKPGTLK